MMPGAKWLVVFAVLVTAGASPAPTAAEQAETVRRQELGRDGRHREDLLNKAAAEPIDILNFLVDARTYIGREVMVRGCSLAFASTASVACVVQPGQILLDGPTMDREDLRRAIKNCANIGKPECAVSVTGTVYDAFAELGVPDNPNLGMRNVSLRWATP